jgi:1-acyl-sn-glycerol-3-phosphate acyltransferase
VPAPDDMAEIKPQVYKDPRPAGYFDRFHAWARTHGAGRIYDVARLVVTPFCLFVYRCRAIGAENVPARGGFILAPNHFSNLDHFFAGLHLRRKIRFMAKSQLFGHSRILTYILRTGGAFPIRRGQRDSEAFATAHAILDRGDCLLIYAEGGRSRTGRLGQPRPGVGRLALESGVAVVPATIHGSLEARKWRKLRFPKVTVQYGEPLVFDVVERPTREQQLEAAERIFEPVREMYAMLEERGRASVIRSLREPARGDHGANLPAGEAR